jgi:hypothetical protein
MTASTVVLMASLSIPLLMHWATVPIPAYSSPPDVAIASAPTIARPTVQPAEFPLENIDLPSAADSAGVAGRSQESAFADALFGRSTGWGSQRASILPCGPACC